MKKYITKLYHEKFIKNKNIHLVENSKLLRSYKNIDKIGKVFIAYFHQEDNHFFITEKGIFSYSKNSSFSINWNEFKELSIGYSGNTVFLGMLYIYVNQGKVFYSFFKELQKTLNNTSIDSDEEAFKLLKESQIKMKMIEEKLDFYISVVASLNKIEKRFYYM
jgi:hypothetical protein